MMLRRLALIALPLALLTLASCGDGALKRHVTLSGLYTVCKPDGYPVVCFLDADGKQGGLFCMPLEAVGGKCL
jgi:hypothetical protein